MFHTNLKNIRLQCKRTQNDIAEYLHISPQSVSKWEKGESSPSIEYLPKLAEYLNCKIDDFFKETTHSNIKLEKIRGFFETMANQDNGIRELEKFIRNNLDIDKHIYPFAEDMKKHKTITSFDIQNYLECSLEEAKEIVNYMLEDEYLIDLDDNRTFIVVKQSFDGIKTVINAMFELITLKDKTTT